MSSLEERNARLDRCGRPRFQTVNTEPSKTIQSDAELTDIRRIIARYEQTGIVDHLNQAEAQFADVTELTDYADVMRTAKLAEREFLKLDPKERLLFDNDVAKWLDAAHDDAKREAMVDAGELPSEALEDVVAPMEPTGGE